MQNERHTNDCTRFFIIYRSALCVFTQNVPELATYRLRFVYDRLLRGDNRLMDAGSTGSCFIARNDSRNAHNKKRIE